MGNIQCNFCGHITIPINHRPDFVTILPKIPTDLLQQWKKEQIIIRSKHKPSTSNKSKKSVEKKKEKKRRHQIHRRGKTFQITGSVFSVVARGPPPVLEILGFTASLQPTPHPRESPEAHGGWIAE